MWNKLRSFLGIKDPVPRYVVVKWKMGYRWAIKDKRKNKYRSFTISSAWYLESDTYFVTCCTTSNRQEAVELCAYLNNNGTLWKEE